MIVATLAIIALFSFGLMVFVYSHKDDCPEGFASKWVRTCRDVLDRVAISLIIIAVLLVQITLASKTLSFEEQQAMTELFVGFGFYELLGILMIWWTIVPMIAMAAVTVVTLKRDGMTGIEDRWGESA